MLPSYQSVSYEAFYESFHEKDEREKETAIREASVFVELSLEEIEALVGFVADPNGVPYGPSNVKNLGPKELHEIIVAVCMQIGKIKIDLVSSDEKKNYLNGQSISETLS